MNSPKVVVALGIIVICSVVLTACGGGGSAPKPPVGAPTIQTATLPQGAVNAAYLINGNPVILSATGGTSPYTWSISSGSLPPGLTLDPAQGIISGTPTTAGNFSFTARVTDAANMTDTANLSIYIEGVVSITPMTLPSGAAGVPYSQTLTATGGVPPYTWCVLGGSPATCDPTQASLPAGLTLNTSTGVLSGTPTTDGPPTTFMIQVSDSETSPGHPAVGSATFTITIMSITTTSLPSGYINTPYNATLTVAGGVTPYSWTAANLPPGISLDPACGGTKLQTCAVKGTPTQPGKFNSTISVTDGEKVHPATTSAMYSISVYQASQLTITTTALPPATEGVAYNGSLTATGGITPYTWSISSGTLPTGLSLDPTTCTKSSVPCMIVGTPDKSGPFNFTVQVQDSGDPQQQQQQTATEQFSILVLNPPPLVITTTSLPAGLQGVPYSGTLTAIGGVKPYNWTITGGTLPPGLILDPTTCTNSSVPCVISGTPTSTGSYPFTVQVADSGNPQQKVPAQLTILISSISNGSLNGNYVFNFYGYKNGSPVVMAGSFVADGNGNVTSGVLDYNDGTGEPVDGSGNPIPQTIQAGSGSVYSITPTGLGTMTITTTNPTVFQFSVTIRSDGSGRLIQSDPANPKQYGSGIIDVTTPLSQGQQWPLCGGYVAVGLVGTNNTLVSRYAAAGEFRFDPSTCVDAENGNMDVNNGGTPSSATFTGAFNQFNNTTSRGIAGMTFNPGGRHFHAFYLVSSSDHKNNQLLLVSTEAVSLPANLTLWSGLQQESSALFGPSNWNNLALAGTAVAELTALDTSGTTDVTAGLFVGTGSQKDTCQNNTFDAATFTFDENQGGVCNGGTCGSQPQSSTGMYCVDKNTGRVTLQGFTGQFGQNPPVLYLVGANQALVVGTDPAVTSGEIESQSGSPFSNSSLFGLYAGATIVPASAQVTNSVSELFADGSGNINGKQNTSGPNGPGGPTNFVYTYTVDGTGRVIVQQNGSTIGIAYVISGTKFVLLPATDPNPALSIFGE